MKYIFAFLLLFLITVFALAAAQFIGMGLISIVWDIPFTEFTSKVQNMNEHPELRTPILVLQGFTQIFSFFAAALFFVKYIYKFDKITQNGEAVQAMNPKLVQRFLEEPFLQRHKTPVLIFLVVIVLAVVAFPAVWVTGALNGVVEFPEALKGIEIWMREQENNAQTLTMFMTDFSSPLQTVLGFIVIAVLAGLTEEVFFRGVVQPLFQNLTKNKHAAIWITAIIFSAIHFQFYGFVPRMLLGALFGYLYVYTNNITVPIWAHILNNGLTLLMFLFIDKEMLNAPKMEGADFATMIPLGILSLLLCIGILKFIKKTMDKEVEKNNK
jgi:membrane protease YdiL (CAAX protease family)